MSLVVATGSNMGDRAAHLARARGLLEARFGPAAGSRVYSSEAEGGGPAFLNQVLEFATPRDAGPGEALGILLSMERAMGRARPDPGGARPIDLDILFWDDLSVDSPGLTIPHPRLFGRSFVVRPLMELPCSAELRGRHRFAESFPLEAVPLRR